jgi:hypothetical protein
LVNRLAEWQVSHARLVGRWFVGLDTGVTPRNTWPLWQVAQPLTMPLWFITPEPGPVPEAWHRVQGCVVGKWLAGRVVVVTELQLLVLVWQALHSCVVATWPEGLPLAPSSVPLWQAEHTIAALAAEA